jgi:glutathione synthase/RimK-type ligase-like ATP-grasp enzyme
MSHTVAIHHREGSYSERWIEYCRQNGIPQKIVNCYDSGIIGKLSNTKILLWHWGHYIPQDVLIARHIIASAEKMGITVYPNSQTCWHFDDKIAQKYLLESIGAPLVPTYVFYTLEDACQWIDKTSFPKVFKLRKGAGGSNVRLIKSAAEARRLVKQAFGPGFKPVAGYFSDLEIKLRKTKTIDEQLSRINRFPQVFRNIYQRNKLIGFERGYIYFQEFLPDNDYDIRVVAIGGRIFAYRRKVRRGDFRASGTGNFDFDIKKIDMRCVQLAYDISRKVGAQSLAFDFVHDVDGGPKIIEMSYCFGTEGFSQCEGYFDPDLNWRPEKIKAEDAILIDCLASV